MKNKYVIENYILRIVITVIVILAIGVILIAGSTQIENDICKNLCSTLGSAFVISGVYNVLYEFVLRNEMIATVVEKVKIKRSIDDTGLADIYLRIDDIPYRSMIENTTSKIIIMHSYGKNWTIQNIGYIKDVCNKRRIAVKVLLLNPDSAFCNSLDFHYCNEKQSMKERIKEMADKWKQLGEDVSRKSSLEVFYFDGNPSHSIYIFDNEMIIIPSKTTNDFTYEIPAIHCQKDNRNNKKLYNAYLSEIESLEKKAKRV